MIILPATRAVLARKTAASTLWTPANASPWAWWDFSDTDNTTIISSAYSAIADKSGNGRSLSQATAGSRPTVGTQNGLNCAVFSGSQSISRTGSSQSLSGFHIFVAFNYTGATSTTGSNRIFSTATATATDSATGGGFALIRANNTSNVALINASGTSLSSTSITFNTFNLVSSSHSGSQAAVSLNGNTATTATNTFSTRTITQLLLGANSVGAGLFFGQMGEVTFFTTQQSTDITDRMIGYYAHKWGTTASLAAGHPYLSSPPTV